MPPIKLKAILKARSLRHQLLIEATGLSKSSVSQILGHNRWPRMQDREQLRRAMTEALLGHGMTEEELRDAFDTTNGRRKADTCAAETDKEDYFMMRRQGLFPATKEHFRLFQDPFSTELRGPEDVYLSQSIRYVREAMLHTARHGGFLAIVGESGSGKSTLRRDLIGRIAEDGQPIHVIEPYVLGMEDNDKTGRTLRSLHIAEAIMATVAPHKRINGSPEARFRQLHNALRESSRSGYKHVLIIEEAHGLSTPTIKHLKRFLELEDGFTKLVGIILIGQPELMQRLGEGNHEVREVVQRCEMVTLKPLNGDLDKYLAHKLARSGCDDIARIITPEGVEALREKLTGPVGRGGQRDRVSLCYPLAVGNLLIAAMNQAAEIGAPIVDADVIRAV